MKLLPVIVKEVTDSLPPVLRPFTKLNYAKPELQDWFWHRLAKVICTPFAPKNKSADAQHQKKLHASLLRSHNVFTDGNTSTNSMPFVKMTESPLKSTKTKKKGKLPWNKGKKSPTIKFQKAEEECNMQMDCVDETPM